jgi:hypothetical protein
VNSFNLGERRGHDPRNLTSDIATLDHVARAESKFNHERVHDCGNILQLKVSCNWWRRREGVAWQRWNNDMIWQRFRSIFLRQNIQNGEKLHKVARPAVKEHQWNSVWLLGEEGDEVNAENVSAFRNLYGKVWKTIDTALTVSPGVLCQMLNLLLHRMQ